MGVDEWIKILRAIITHIIALIVIIPFIVILSKSSKDATITVSPLLLSISSIIIGYYFGRYVDRE